MADETPTPLHVRMQRLADHMDLVAHLLRAEDITVEAAELEDHAECLRVDARLIEERVS